MFIKGVIKIPKIIENILGNILHRAEIILKTDGYEAMSIRRIARECNSAVGTIYNYFEDKDSLVACVILNDWKEATEGMTELARSANSYADGVVGLYNAIKKFESSYKNVWKDYSKTAGSHRVVADHHMNLRIQISGILDTLAMRTGAAALIESSPIIAEAVIAATLQPDMDENTIRRLAERLALQ